MSLTNSLLVLLIISYDGGEHEAYAILPLLILLLLFALLFVLLFFFTSKSCLVLDLTILYYLFFLS